MVATPEGAKCRPGRQSREIAPFELPSKATRYARDRMAALVCLIAQEPLRFASWSDLARLILPACARSELGACLELLRSPAGGDPHPANLEVWLRELKRLGLVSLALVFDTSPPESSPERSIDAAPPDLLAPPGLPPSPSMQVSLRQAPEALIAAGFAELETLLPQSAPLSVSHSLVSVSPVAAGADPADLLTLKGKSQ